MAYTIAEAREVMAETSRLLARDTRRKPDPREPRAAAQTKPPAEKFTFQDEIVRHQEEDDSRTLSEATRLAANSRPDLREAFVKEQNEKLAASEQEKKESAARFRRRNR